MHFIVEHVTTIKMFFVLLGKNLNSAYYCLILKRFLRHITGKRPERWIFSIVIMLEEELITIV